MSRLREAQAKQIELENAETEEAARNKLKSTTPTASGFKPVPVEEMRKLPYFNNEVVRNLSKFPQAMPVGLRAVANERMPEMMATLVNDFLSTKAGAGLSVADGVKYIQRTLDKLDPRDLWGAIADTYQDRAQLDSLMKAYDGIK